MSLTFGAAPFGTGGGTWSFSVPSRVWYLEAWPRRMRAMFAGETVLDTRRAQLLYETGAFPVHFFPLDDIQTDLLLPSDNQTSDEHRGAVRRFDVRIGDRTATAAVTSYPSPTDNSPPLANYASVDFGSMDRWFEEDEPIYAHPRDPYHRVDVRASSMHIIVSHAGDVIAETTRPKLLFETAVPIRYYLPLDDVRFDLLERSDTISECPYKGDGQHWNLVIGADRTEDVAWTLPHPLPEGLAAAEHVSFYPNKVEITVDGHRIES